MEHRLAPEAENDLDSIGYRIEGDDVRILRVLGGSQDIEALRGL